MATRGPFTEFDWAGATLYDVARVARLFVWHAELAALAREPASELVTLGRRPDAVKEKSVEADVGTAARPGPAATTSSALGPATPAAPGGCSRR
jgi:hypothetical protein